VRRRWVGAVAVVLVAAGCGSDDADQAGTEPTTTSAAPEESCPEAPNPPPTSGLPPPPEETSPLFVPATSRDGDRTVMPVTFPDGTTAELVYEPDLALEDAQIAPGWAGGTTPGEVSRDFIIRYGSLTDRPGFLSELVTTEASRPDALVCVYRVDALDNDYLMFQFEDWVVGIHSADNMSPEVRRAWTNGLTLRTAPDGFPILSATGAVEFSTAGPGIEFQKGGPGVALILGGCAPEDDAYESDELAGYGRRCVPGTGVAISVNHYSGATVDEVLQGVDVRNVVRRD
jgi:hypothetical protein